MAENALNPTGRDRFSAGLRVGLAALFLFSGVSKAWDPAAFAGDIANYRLTPWTLTIAAALYLPWLEIFAALGLFFRRTQTGALLITSALLVMFCGALASAWWRDLNIHCGCFGGGGPGVQAALLRNLLLLAACALIVRSENKPAG